eukprot:1811563-Ditylum_brightwellii.AAC.1
MNRSGDWFMSKFHKAAALSNADFFSNVDNVGKEEGINSKDHFLCKTPLHVATEVGNMEVLDALLGNEACNSNLKDLND